jgi:nitroreductase
VLELLDLARWAPNHRVTNPWRFRVLGPGALHRLSAAAEQAKPGAAAKLRRAPTLIAATARQTGDPGQDRDDLLAAGVASYIVLLAAHARGLGGYWRTVPLLDQPAGRAALGIGADEVAVGLLHLGWPDDDADPSSDRAPLTQVATFLD